MLQTVIVASMIQLYFRWSTMGIKSVHQFDLDLEPEPAHATLSASSAHRWIACPASVKAQKGFPDTSGAAAEEGTALHACAEESLREMIHPYNLVGEEFNGYTITRELAYLVNIYVEHCYKLPRERVYIEQRLDYSPWADGGFGTADYLAISDRGGEAWIVDAKFGRNQVDADNDQLKCYALGVHNEFGFDAQLDIYHMTIVQPRLGHIDTHTMTGKELLAWGRNTMAPAAKAALSDDPPYQAGEKQCRYCRAAGGCEAQYDHAVATLGNDFKDLTQAAQLTTEQLTNVLPQLGFIKNWCEQVAKHAEESAQAGTQIKGYKLVESRTNRKWSDESEALRVMRSLTNEPVQSLKPISPSQAIRMLGPKCEELNELIVKPNGRPTLVPNADKRPELNTLEGFNVIED